MTSFLTFWAIVLAIRVVGVAVCLGMVWVCQKRGKPTSPWDKLHLLFINIELVLGHDFAGGFGLFLLPWTIVFVGATSALLALILYGVCRWFGMA